MTQEIPVKFRRWFQGSMFPGFALLTQGYRPPPFQG